MVLSFSALWSAESSAHAALQVGLCFSISAITAKWESVVPGTN